MKDEIQQEPGRMLIGRDRLYYSGLLGSSMRTRRLGAVSVYAAPSGTFDISVEGGPWETKNIFALAPFTAHKLRSESGRILNVCIESESVGRTQVGSLIAMLQSGADRPRRLDRLRAANRTIMANDEADGFTTAQFDELVLGERLAARAMDPRIVDVVETFRNEVDGGMISADDCASDARLSTSRFLHLFKEMTDLSFRSHRMWKRARRFMDHANRSDCLTFVALDLGYPDSSHFSHSIRKTFGLQPRSIREGSRNLKLFTGENYQLSVAVG